MTELEALAAAVVGEQDFAAESGGQLATADGLSAPDVIKSEQLAGSTQAGELAAQRTGSLPQPLGGAATGGGAADASGSYTSGTQALDDGSGTLSDERTAPLMGEAAAAAAAAAVLAGAQPNGVFFSPSQLHRLVQSHQEQAGGGSGLQRSKRNTRQQEQNKMVRAGMRS